MNKVIRKAKEGADESKIQYKKINKFKNLQIHGYADASFKTQDGKTRSVEGRILFLTNGRKASQILWKSKKISRVADSTKSAETLAMDKASIKSIQEGKHWNKYQFTCSQTVSPYMTLSTGPNKWKGRPCAMSSKS